MKRFAPLFLLLISCIFSHATFFSPTTTTTLFVGQNYNTPAMSVMPRTHDTIFKNFPSSSLDSAKAGAIPVERLCTQIKEINPDWSKQDFANYFIQTSGKNELALTPLGTHFESLKVQPPKSSDYYEVTPARQVAICQNLQLYTSPGFRDYVRTLPEFSKFIVEWKNQLWHNPKLIEMRNAQLGKIPEIRAVYNERQSTFCSLMCEWFKDQCYITKQEVIANDTVAQVPAITKQVQETMADPLISPQLENVCQTRLDALQKTIATNGACTVQKIEVTPALIHEAQNHGLSPQQLEVSCGSAIMHTLNGESVDILEQTWQLPEGFLIPDVRKCAFAALSYTHEGKIGKAIALTDVCYVALDHLARFGALTADCVQGVGLGFYDAGSNIIAMVTDPIKTITDLAHMTYYAGKAACAIAHVKPLGWIASSATLEQQIAAIENAHKDTITIAHAVAQKLAAMPARELIRHGTSFLVEGWLTGKSLTALGSLCKKAGTLCSVASNIIKATVRGSEVLEPVAAGIGKVERLKPSRIQMWFNQAEGQIKNVVQEIKQIVPGKVKGYISACGENFEHLSRMYDGIVTFKDKLVRISYKHLFGLEIEEITKQTGRIERNFSGFHHDHLGELEKSGVIQLLNKQICSKTGVIEADVVWNGVTKSKTLFPTHWTREQVIEKVLEALQNPIKVEQKANGIFEVTGITQEKLKVIIYVNEKSKVITAYPTSLSKL